MLSKLCQGLPSFAAEKLHLGFSEEMVKESQEKLKINKVSYETNKKQTKITINFSVCVEKNMTSQTTRYQTSRSLVLNSVLSKPSV